MSKSRKSDVPFPANEQPAFLNLMAHKHYAESGNLSLDFFYIRIADK